jgi:hypothetical protein
MKLCAVVPARSAARAMRSLRSCGKRIVVVLMARFGVKKMVAQQCYIAEEKRKKVKKGAEANPSRKEFGKEGRRRRMKIDRGPFSLCGRAALDGSQEARSRSDALGHCI